MAVIDAERAAQVEPTAAAPKADERVSWARLAWVGPLTVVAAMAACALVRFVAQSIDPSLTRMGQLGPAMLQLAFIGSVGAVIVFALMALLLPRPITWFRRLAVLVWAVSILPDLALGFGGSTALLGMRAMGPFLGLEIPYLSQRQGPPPGAGPRPSPPPGGFVMPAQPIEHVALLILLHAVVAVVCVVMLTTLARRAAPSAEAAR